jgi:hypothetical protein
MPAMPVGWAEDRPKFSRCLETTASNLGLETEPTFSNYTEVDKLLGRDGLHADGR